MAILIVIGFMMFAGFLVFLTILNAKQAEEKLTKSLIDLGFKKCLDKSIFEHVSQELCIVNSRHQDKRLLMKLYAKDDQNKDVKIYLCDYYFASGSGRARGGNAILICFIFQNLHLPRFTLESTPEGSPMLLKMFEMISNAMPFPDLKRMDTAQFGFNQNFNVYSQSTNGIDVVAIKEPIVTTFKSHSGICVDAKDGTIILSDIQMRANQVGNKPLDVNKVKELVQIGVQFRDNIKS